MRKPLFIVGMVLLIFMFVSIFASSSYAQGVLDNTWFSLKVKTKTLWWQSTSEPIQSRTDSFNAYMHLVWQSENMGIQNYACEIWTQNATGVWENSDTMAWIIYNENDKVSLVQDFTDAVTIWYVGDKRFTTDASFMVKISADSAGAFKKATFSSLGCTVSIALSSGDAIGGCTIKGKSLKEAPFF